MKVLHRTMLNTSNMLIHAFLSHVDTQISTALVSVEIRNTIA